MKKILLASTALVLSAGVAAANVSVSGDGRMGVVYNSDNASGNKFNFTSRIRITFRASGQTDGGLNFGGVIRADNAGNGALGGANAGQTAGSVFISGEFGRISMGDVDGAAEYVVGDLHFRSLLAGGTAAGSNFAVHESDFLSNDGATDRPAMRYDYSFDAFTFAISANNPGGAADEVYALGVGYDAGMFGVGLGHERNRDTDVNHTIGAVTASVDGVADFKAIYGRASGGFKQYGISAEGTFDATTVSAFARRVDDGTDRVDYIGIGAAYNLGGGAQLAGGIIREKEQGSSSTTRADFGVRMSF